MKKTKEILEDRLVTPYIIYTYLPTQEKYVNFPFAEKENKYQETRFYSDEVPLKLKDFAINGMIPNCGKLVAVE